MAFGMSGRPAREGSVVIVIPNVLHDTPSGFSRAAVEGIAVAVALRLAVGRAAMGNPKLSERFQEAPCKRVPRMTRAHKLLMLLRLPAGPLSFPNSHPVGCSQPLGQAPNQEAHKTHYST